MPDGMELLLQIRLTQLLLLPPVLLALINLLSFLLLFLRHLLISLLHMRETLLRRLQHVSSKAASPRITSHSDGQKGEKLTGILNSPSDLSPGGRQASPEQQQHVHQLEQPQSLTAPAVQGAHIELFRSILKSMSKDANERTADMCAEVVKRTKSCPRHMSALIDLPELQEKRTGDGRPWIAEATCFVSHSWQANLQDTMDALEQYEQGHTNTYFWFDMFVNSQHSDVTRELDRTWWCTRFEESIVKIRKVLVIMTPWDNPLPPTRAWCVWEAYCALRSHADITMILPTSQRQAFLQRATSCSPTSRDASEDSDSLMITTLLNIDVEKAKASMEDDLKEILRAVHEVGVCVVNKGVRDALRDAFINMCIDIASTDFPIDGGSLASQAPKVNKDHLRGALVLHRTARIVLQFGKHEEAILLFEKQLKIASELTEGSMPGALECGTGATPATHAQAEELISAAHVGLGQALFARSNALQKTKGNKRLARMKLQESKNHFTTAFELLIRAHGDSYPAVSEVYMCLGNIAAENSADLDEAERCYKEALRIRQKIRGKDDHAVAAVYYNLGYVNCLRKEYAKSEEFFSKARNIYKLSTSNSHSPQSSARTQSLNSDDTPSSKTISPQTLISAEDPVAPKPPQPEMNTNLSHPIQYAICCAELGMVIFRHSGDKIKALEHIREAINIGTAVLDSKHPRIATWVENERCIMAHRP